MDDGYWSTAHKTIFLCTEDYTLEEIHFLCKMLNDNLGIIATSNIRKLKPDGRGRRIRISVDSLVHLRNLVLPHMHQSMKFKLGL